ncbi:MAG: hypothetical protein ABJA87_07890 [bacterium]
MSSARSDDGSTAGTPGGAGRLRVDADLHLEIDGRPVAVTGSGRRIVVSTDSPAAVFDQIASAALPVGVGRMSGARALGRLADGLAGSDLELVVTGPSGAVATFGAGSRSRLAQLVTGSRHVRFGSARTLAPVVAGRLRGRTTGGLGHLRQRVQSAARRRFGRHHE